MTHERWIERYRQAWETADEDEIADLFTPYYGFADLGYAYRFYVEPPPTPVITATLQFGEDRPADTIRSPSPL